MSYYVGLDLGQANDYTAVCVAEDASKGGELKLNVRTPRALQGPPLPGRGGPRGGPAREGAAQEPLKNRSVLMIDATGVGPAVTDVFTKRRRPFKAVKIHGGDAETRGEGGVYRVPKRNLISALQVLLQNGSLRIASGLELAEALRKELLNFRVKINVATAHDSYEAWREGDHDDLVLAAALAAWGAAKFPSKVHAPIGVGLRPSHFLGSP